MSSHTTKKPPDRADSNRITGIIASSGIAIGTSFVLQKNIVNLPRYWISNKEVATEITRFKQALNTTQEELKEIKEKLCKFEGKEQIHILDAYGLILQDEMLTHNTVQSISNEHINAEWALHKNIEKIKDVFLNVDTTIFRERTFDFDYIGERILNHLVGKVEDIFHHIPPRAIIVAHDLSPAETAQLMKYKIQGIVTEIGGQTSHTAIISRALKIPAVVGCKFITQKVHTNDHLIIDGNLGQIILRPSDAQEKKYQLNKKQQDRLQKRLLKNICLPAETKDKYQIRLAANMELTEEINSIKANGAEGIGLYRTEFLFLNKTTPLTEEEHFQNYQEVLKAIYPHSATIRTIDIGGDKVLPNNPYSSEFNPALGLKAIRFAFKEKHIFKTQLRALLRASIHGKLKILIPMVSGLEELRQVKKLLQVAKNELSAEHIPFDAHVKLGIMIEVPSSVMVADDLANEVDFFSIGTNDLIQYTLAIDRSNEHVAYLYDPLHPAVLKMLQMTIEAAHRHKIEVSICGEMASSPLFILILLGFGLSELSMNALSIPRAKRIIRSVNYSDTRVLLEKTMSLKTSSEMNRFVHKELHNLLGKSFKEFSLY